MSDILYFPLQDILSRGHLLAVQPTTGIVSHLYSCEEGPRIQGACIATESELRALLPLLQSYPHCCPYERVLASYNTSSDMVADDELVARVGAWLSEAENTEAWDTQLRPVRNILSRIRLKLLPLGLDIASVLGSGYLLCTPPARSPAKSRLQAARELCGLSQQEVADQIETTALNVSRWERGITRPGPYFRAKLCQLFGKSPDELDLGPAPALAGDGATVIHELGEHGGN